MSSKFSKSHAWTGKLVHGSCNIINVHCFKPLNWLNFLKLNFWGVTLVNNIIQFSSVKFYNIPTVYCSQTSVVSCHHVFDSLNPLHLPLHSSPPLVTSTLIAFFCLLLFIYIHTHRAMALIHLVYH